MPSRFMATVTGRSLSDHMCWPFHGIDDLVTGARNYVVEGLDRHERVTFCKLEPAGMHHAVVSDVAQVQRAAHDHLPVLAPLVTEPGWTPWTSPVVPFGRMTDAAVADGYAGLRILTDATELARYPETRQQWTRSEHLIDSYGLDHPVAIVCGYDVDDLGEEVVAEVACVHSLTGESPCRFLLRAADPAGGLALSGEVDRESAADLYHAVVQIAAGRSAPLVVDVSEHEFLDHTALVALHRASRTVGTSVTLVGASPLTALLVDAFGLTRITVREA